MNNENLTAHLKVKDFSTWRTSERSSGSLVHLETRSIAPRISAPVSGFFACPVRW